MLIFRVNATFLFNLLHVLAGSLSSVQLKQLGEWPLQKYKMTLTKAVFFFFECTLLKSTQTHVANKCCFTSTVVAK